MLLQMKIDFSTKKKQDCKKYILIFLKTSNVKIVVILLAKVITFFVIISVV